MGERKRVDLDPLADEALDRLEAAMPSEGWQANRSNIASALIYYASPPRAFNRLTYTRDAADD